MTELFNKCILVILKNEGKFQCNPDDYGNWTGSNRTGELIGTNYGIAARYFNNICDIKNLTKEQAIEIYYKYFWIPMNLEGIKDKELVLHIFDHGVNSNKRLAIRMVQKIIEVKSDGIMGPVTKKAINNWKPIVKVIEGYGLLNSLLDHYKYARHCHYVDQVRKYPVKSTFYKGWINRIERCFF